MESESANFYRYLHALRLSSEHSASEAGLPLVVIVRSNAVMMRAGVKIIHQVLLTE